MDAIGLEQGRQAFGQTAEDALWLAFGIGMLGPFDAFPGFELFVPVFEGDLAKDVRMPADHLGPIVV